VKANSPNGSKNSTSYDIHLELMKAFGLRLTLTYRLTLQETIKLVQASPGIGLLWIGAAALLAAAFLMLLLVALLP